MRPPPPFPPPDRFPGSAELTRAESGETLESGYQAYGQLKRQSAAALQRDAEQRQQLAQQGEFLVGTARAASAGMERLPDTGPGLARREGLESFLASAEAKLALARAALEQRAEEEKAEYSRALDAWRGQLRERVARFLSRVKPRLALTVRPLGASQRIVHLARVRPDEAVLLMFLLTGRIPSQYDFLFDDSTDDATLAPAPLYPEEGNPQIRPGATGLRERVFTGPEPVPLKGFLPVLVPRPGEAANFYRLLQRGPVMELEIADGEGFRNLLSPAEAERFAGHLLRLKLEGRIELELETG
jgi:hypothetical protein